MEVQAEMGQQITVTLEVVPEESHDPDAALVSEVSRKTVDALKFDGYQVQAAYTGLRGGPELFQVIFSALQTAGTFVMVHKDVLETVGTICSIFATVSPVVKHLFSIWNKQARANSAQPLKVTIEIDGTPVSVETQDVEDAEAILKLAQQYHSRHPQPVTAKSRIKVKASVPKKPVRRRR